jgi:hypothetical protein
MVGLKDMYLAIGKDIRKIFVNAPKQIVSPFQLSSDSLLTIFKNESYQLSTSEEGDRTTLRFSCPNHVYCKEYRFVISGNRLYETSMRLTDLSDPLNDAKDTRVKITITHWQESNLPLNLLKAATYVKMQNGILAPSGSYVNYELIDYLTVNAD